MAWGITVHKGHEYGLINQLTLSVITLGIIAVIVSGIVLWWKRKPQDHLGSPKAPEGMSKGFNALMIIMGIIFPLVGLSLVILLVFDWWKRGTVLCFLLMKLWYCQIRAYNFLFLHIG